MTTQELNKSTTFQRINKTNIQTLLQKKQQDLPITMLTAYDYSTSHAVDQVGIDMILVGDSLGMVFLGYSNTLAVTMDDMIHHCKAVSRGAHHAMLIGDMPFMSYQISINEAVKNAGRFLQEASMDGVKLEGGRERIETIRAIRDAGIPVMGHIGFTPQSINQLGGFRRQGKSANAAKRLLEDAILLQESGCFSIVLELIPARLAQWISGRLEIPTIGIGSGSGCDGQVLVIHDMLGLYDQLSPKFVKKYLNINQEIKDALKEYKEDVENHLFPSVEHSFEMNEEEWELFLQDEVNQSFIKP